MTTHTSAGSALIARERIRQITDEDYQPEHDIGRGAQLANAAVSYAAFAAVTIDHYPGNPEAARAAGAHLIPPMWPWSSIYWKPTGEPEKDLIKAGALIAAALDALRAES